MTQVLSFEVQGSAAEPYSVVFKKRSETNLSAYCSCPAGENGQYCKHRFNILDGATRGIVSGNLDDLKVVQSWLVGTDLEKALVRMRELEAQADTINKALAAAKKEVAKAMRDLSHNKRVQDGRKVATPSCFLPLASRVADEPTRHRRR